MRVYRFLGSRYGLQSLRERRLRISRLLELNDPFEFLAIDVSEPTFRRAFNSGRDNISKKFGLICFSKNWRSPLQWAHYADLHRGICLGFDIPDRHLNEVHYVEERFPIDSEMNEALVKKLLYTKFSQWSYEEEYRAFVPLEEAEGENYFIDFGENQILKEVFVGAYSTITRANLKKSLGNLASEVEAHRVRPGFQNFELVKQKKEGMWK